MPSLFYCGMQGKYRVEIDSESPSFKGGQEAIIDWSERVHNAKWLFTADERDYNRATPFMKYCVRPDGHSLPQHNSLVSRFSFLLLGTLDLIYSP